VRQEFNEELTSVQVTCPETDSRPAE
jgi:hypothetical protein